MREFNKRTLDEYVAEGKTVLVEFSAPWCVYCRRLAPAMEKIAEEYKDILTVGSVNIDNEQELARQERIEVVPTLVLYKNGQAVDSIVGPGSKAAVEDFIQKNSLSVFVKHQRRHNFNPFLSCQFLLIINIH